MKIKYSRSCVLRSLICLLCVLLLVSSCDSAAQNQPNDDIVGIQNTNAPIADENKTDTNETKNEAENDTSEDESDPPDAVCQHESFEWIVRVEATLDSEGKKEKVCSICQEVLDSENIPTLECSHEAFEWIIDSEPTLDRKGERHKVCDLCRDTIETEEIPRLALPDEEIYSMLQRCAVKVVGYKADGTTVVRQGSGFFIDTNGTFVTNAHVVRSCYYVRITDYLGNEYEADLMFLYDYSTSDIAILRSSEYKNSAPISFCELSAETTDPVFALGFPLDAEKAVLTKGQIIDGNYELGAISYTVSSASVKPGSSGGILANGKGEVIGITTGEFKNGYCAALTYSNISKAINNELSEGRPPHEFFIW